MKIYSFTINIKKIINWLDKWDGEINFKTYTYLLNRLKNLEK